MSTYAPSSIGHMILSRLAQGPASKDELNAACHVEHDEEGRRKVWFVLRALKDDELVASNSGANFIRPHGRKALSIIEGGEIYPPPQSSIRVFADGKGAGEGADYRAGTRAA